MRAAIDSPIERLVFFLSDTVAKIFNAIGLQHLFGTIQVTYVICASNALKIKGQIITVNNDEGAVRLGAAGEDGGLLFAERIEHEGNHVLARRLPFDCFPGDYYFQPKVFTEKRFGLT